MSKYNYYYVFDHIDKLHGHKIRSWRIETINFCLDEKSDLIKFVSSLDEHYKDVVLIYWKKLRSGVFYEVCKYIRFAFSQLEGILKNGWRRKQ